MWLSRAEWATTCGLLGNFFQEAEVFSLALFHTLSSLLLLLFKNLAYYRYGSEIFHKKREDYLEWPEYFMAVAFLSAQRSKDPNSQVRMQYAGIVHV